MRILVLGAGAIGGYFGGRLAESGADVTFMVRARRKAELDAHGLVVKSTIGDIALPVKTCAAGEGGAAYDLVLLSCKAYDLDDAIAAFAPALAAAGAVLPVLNGLRHLDVLAERLGRARVLGGAAYIGAALEPGGAIRHIGDAQTLVFGELDGTISARVTAIGAIVAHSKAEALASPAILQAMWEKLVMLAALAATTSLARATVGAIVAAQSGLTFMGRALAECAAVAAAEGHAASAEALARSRALLTTRGSNFSASLMRDLIAGRRTEGDQIIGDLVRRGRRHGLAVPILETALTVLEVHEGSLKGD
jgi:2-dehydropantoate 2-reductase